MIKMIEDVIKKFDIKGELVNIEINDSGNINNTYVATFKLSNNCLKKYLVQRINTTVFTEPYKLMSNIEKVTKFIKKEQLNYTAKINNYQEN